MNAERLLNLYERIAEAPDAVARLRRFVLDLAVRGKLVAQDEGDEPALELLKRIAQEKARMARVGEIKSPKPLDPVMDAGEFDLPKSWDWTRLGTITSYMQRGKSPKYAAAEGLPVVSQRCVRWDGLDLDAAKLITRESLSGYEPVRFIRDGDLLWNSTGTGTIGRVVRVVDPPDQLVCDSHVTVVRCALCDPEYVRTWLRSDHVYGLIEGRAAGSTNQVELTAQMAANQLVPLPPLAEQQRIVAKVDELMALCDRLEAARKAREAKRDQLAAASLARLNTPDPETFPADARFALDALPALITRPDQIKPLRQTILNLAVRGKLVAQDADDEPVAQALDRLAREKRAGRPNTPPTWLPPFNAPPSWAWTTLGQLVLAADAGWSPKTMDHARRGDAWGVLKVSAVSWDHFKADENKELLPGTDPRLQAQVRAGDFLISRANTAELVARAVIVEAEPINLMLSDKIVRLQLSTNCNPHFVLMVNNHARFARLHYAQRASGVSPSMKNVSRDVIMALAIPFPPLPEQNRIVIKVNELMTLCDKLEASLAEGTKARTRLLEATLAEALEPRAVDLAA